MPKLSCLQDLEDLYRRYGEHNYGEGVTQLEHALQCAGLAEACGAHPSLIAAALLHDVGHFFGREDEALSRDDRHEAIGARLLASLFGPDVCAPIALHVDAKRYLCFQNPRYHDALSVASQQSLLLQGGPFTAVQASAFERQPYWREALALRQFDDTGKRDDTSSRDFADYAPLLRTLLIGAARA